MTMPFDRIALRYDMINRVLSFCRDVCWRKELARALMIGSPRMHLDLACGTGDQVAAMQRVGASDMQSLGVDCSQGMLDVAAQKKIIDQDRTRWVQGDVCDLPFDDGSFDVVTMSFGLRNVQDRSLVLKESMRVLRPGGWMGMLEFSKPSHVFLQRGYLIYLRHVLPLVGGVLSGQGAAYQYLSSSIEAFPMPDMIVDEWQRVGWVDVKVSPVDVGLVYRYVARKSESEP